MERYLPHFTEEVLKRISAATYVAMFADHVAFTETLQRHKDFSLFLQHMAICYKALFADKSSCTSTEHERSYSHLANEFKSIHALRKNIDTVAMLTGDALLHHSRKGMDHGGDRQLHTLIFYVHLTSPTSSLQSYTMSA